MNHIRNTMQHLFNPLHVYCRLRTVGLSGALAKKLSALYERHIYDKAGWLQLVFWNCVTSQAKQKAS